MTRNQLEYWKNQETERHNLAMEQQGLLSLEETKRANQVNENIARQHASIAASSAAETARSNQAREAEIHRSNLASEYQELLRYQEMVRSNQASEEIARQNVAVGWGNVGVAAQNANTNAYNASTNRINAVTNQLEQWNAADNRNKQTNINANRSPYATIVNSPNKITNLKSVATTVGSQAYKAATSLVTNLQKAVTTVTNRVVTTVSKPKTVTTPVSSYLGGSVSKSTSSKATYNYKSSKQSGTRKPR